MRLSNVLELIVVLAVGLAAARWNAQNPEYATYFQETGDWRWYPWVVIHSGNCFFAAASAAGMLGLFAETIARRSPVCWGFGRWAWAVLGLNAVIRYGFRLFDLGLYFYKPNHSLARFWPNIPHHFQRECGWQFLDSTTYVTMACAIVYLMRRRGERLPADAREWSGRTLAAALILSGVVGHITAVMHLV